MKNLKFLQIEKGNSLHLETATNLWVSYFNELNVHRNGVTELDKTLANLQKRVNIQGLRQGMHFEIFYYNDDAVGIANFAIDLGGIKGLLDPGYGFIMEFYISSEFRSKGLGSDFYNHIEEVFLLHGVKYIYLTPDQNTGQPFWTAMGFYNSGIVDPDNKLPIYIKKIK